MPRLVTFPENVSADLLQAAMKVYEIPNSLQKRESTRRHSVNQLFGKLRQAEKPLQSSERTIQKPQVCRRAGEAGTVTSFNNKSEFDSKTEWLTPPVILKALGEFDLD